MVLPKLISVAIGALAAAAVPFIVTGMYRTYDIPTPIPFVILALVGLALLAHDRVRAIGIGCLTGTALYALLLFYLLMSVGNGLKEFGS